MFIKRTEYEKMKARNDYLEKELAGYKEIIDLQNSEDMKKVIKDCEKEEKQKAKNRYCATCKHGIFMPFMSFTTSTLKNPEEYVLCSLQGKIVCSNFDRVNRADGKTRYDGSTGTTSAT